MNLMSIGILLAFCSLVQASKVRALYRTITKSAATKSASELKPDDFLTMPQMMSTMSRFTKGLPIEYRPLPLLVGTKGELIALNKVLRDLKLPTDLSTNFNPNITNDQIMSVPLTLNRLVRPAPVRFSLNEESEDQNGNCGVSLRDLLPLLRTHPIPTIVHDSPEMILRMMRLLVGPKPDRSKSDIARSQNFPSNIQKLVSLATRNPVLVRTLAKFDPQFIPSLVNSMLGLDDNMPLGEP